MEGEEGGEYMGEGGVLWGGVVARGELVPAKPVVTGNIISLSEMDKLITNEEQQVERAKQLIETLQRQVFFFFFFFFFFLALFFFFFFGA